MSALPSVPSSKNPFNSLSSRSWRRNVMMESINAFFNNRNESAPTPAPPSSRHDSGASANSGSSPIQPSEDISEEEKGLCSTPVGSQGSGLEQHEKKESVSSTSSPKEGEIVPKGKKDPFAGGVDGGVTYCTLTWWYAALGMVAETISLGILGLPQTLSTLGLIPGIIIFLLIGAMASYAGYVIGQFKLAFPHVHSMGDAGDILFGFFGRELFGLGAVVFIIFIMGSHLVAGGHTLNVLTDHKACTIWFVVVILAISFLCTLPRTLKKTTLLSAISCVSVLAAVLVVMIDLVQRRPGFNMDNNGKMPDKFTLWGQPNTSLAEKIGAVTAIMFAFAGHVAFFSFISELENPKDFNKSLAFLQTCDITMYTVSSVVVYVFGGERVRSPALDSARPFMRKVAWGVALPTIIIAGVINGHVAVKYLYVRCLRNNDKDIMHQKSFKARAYWWMICGVFWGIAFVLAESMPLFKDIIGITGALFASWFTFGLPGMFWWNMNFRIRRGGRFGFELVCLKEWTWKKSLLLSINIFFVLIACFTMIAGVYASVLSMRKSSASGKGKPFSCEVSKSFS